MVQILIDLRHLTTVSVVGIRRDTGNRTVSVAFEVASRLSNKRKVYESTLPMPLLVDRDKAVSDTWRSILNRDLEDMRRFVYESSITPGCDQDILSPVLWPDDRNDKVPASIVTGLIDGSMLMPFSVDSSKLKSIDASKLTGRIPEDVLRRSHLSFDMLSGDIDGARLQLQSVGSDKIRSVSGACVHGALHASQIAHKTICSEHIQSISWDVIAGPFPARLAQGLKLQDLHGRVEVRQLPEHIPLSMVDLSGGLDLGLFTRGYVDGNMIAPGAIESRHVSSVDASVLTGVIDGQMIRDHSIPAAKIQSIPASVVRGSLQVTDIRCEKLDSIACETGSIRTSSISCSGDVRVGNRMECADLSVSKTMRCIDLYASDTISAHSADFARISCGDMTVDASLHAQDVRSQDIYSTSLETGHLNVSDTFNADSVSAKDITAHRCSAVSIETAHLHAKEVSGERVQYVRVDAETIQAGTLTVKQDASVGGRLNVSGGAVFEEGLRVAGTLMSTEAKCDSLDADAVNVAGAVSCDGLSTRALHCEAASFASDLTVTGAVSARTLSLNGELEVGGISTFREIVANSSIRSETIDVDELDVDDVDVSQCLTADRGVLGDVDVNLLEADSVNTGSLQAKIVSCEAATADRADISYASIDDAKITRAHLHDCRVSELDAQTMSVKRMYAEGQIDVRDQVRCVGDVDIDRDVRAAGMEILGDVSADTLVSEDVVVAGVSLRDFMDRIEADLTVVLARFRAGKVLEMVRLLYYADTQYTSGHDRIEARSSSQESRVYVSFPSESRGLSVDQDGYIGGVADMEGAFSIEVMLETTIGPETFTMKRLVDFIMYSPPEWTMITAYDVVEHEPFDILLLATKAEYYSLEETPFETIVYDAATQSVTGSAGDVGVFEMTTRAHFPLDHNAHVLITDLIIQISSRPQAPDMTQLDSLISESLLAGEVTSVELMDSVPRAALRVELGAPLV